MTMRTLALAAALLVTACASTTETAEAPAADRDCFYNAQINGFDYIDRNHIRVNVGASRAYSFEVTPAAHDLNFDHTIAVIARQPSGWICTGRLTGVRIVGGDPQRSWSVVEIARLPDGEPAPATQGS